MQRLAERQRAAVLSLSSAVPEEETDAVAVASLAGLMVLAPTQADDRGHLARVL
jgi:hypothetical protein